MTPVRIGAVTVQRVVEIEGPNSPRFTRSLFPDLDETLLAPHRGWLAPHYLAPESGRLVMSVHAFVVRTRHHTLVVDTCVGNDKVRSVPVWHQRQGPFLDALSGAGVRPEAVDFVLCTHLHADHVGWNTRLVDGRWVPTFPNARYLIARREWDHWTREGGEETETILADSVRPVAEAGLVERVDGGHAIDDEARIVPTPGHTPGHVSLELSSRGERAVITGDLLHHPFQCAEPEVNSAFCVDGAQARATRRGFLERHADTGTRILGTHFPAPTCGRVAFHGGRFRFVGDDG